MKEKERKRDKQYKVYLIKSQEILLFYNEYSLYYNSLFYILYPYNILYYNHAVHIYIYVHTHTYVSGSYAIKADDSSYKNHKLTEPFCQALEISLNQVSQSDS